MSCTSTTVIAFIYIGKPSDIMKWQSAAAWIMFVLTFGVTLIQWNQQKKWVSRLRGEFYE